MPARMSNFPKRIFLSYWAYTTVRLLLSIVFLYAGVVKLLDPKVFGVVISDFGLLPESWIMPVAIGLPILEVSAAIGLAFNVRGCLGLIAALLIFFIVVLGYALWLGLDIDCGCFGPEDPESHAYGGLRISLYRDLLMAVGVIYMYVWHSRCSAATES